MIIVIFCFSIYIETLLFKFGLHKITIFKNEPSLKAVAPVSSTFQLIFLTQMVLLNFNLVFEGVYCLATKPQSTLPSDLIMQPVTLRYAHKASDMNSHTNYTKVSTFNSEF